MAYVLNGLAELYLAQSRYQECEGRLNRAIVLRERSLGMEHPLLKTPLENLAKLFRKTGRTAKARKVEKRLITIRERQEASVAKTSRA